MWQKILFARHILKQSMKGIVKLTEEFIFYDQVELEKSICFLGDRLNARGGVK